MKSNKESMTIIEQAVCEARPELFDEVDDSIQIDVRALDDPQSTRHIGTHPTILKASAENKAFDQIAAQIAKA